MCNIVHYIIISFSHYKKKIFVKIVEVSSISDLYIGVFLIDY